MIFLISLKQGYARLDARAFYIKGNEIPDKLPKQEVSNHFYGPRPTLGVSKANLLDIL